MTIAIPIAYFDKKKKCFRSCNNVRKGQMENQTTFLDNLFRYDCKKNYITR